MNGGIRSREERKAFYGHLPLDVVDSRRHSTSENGSIEHYPPDPCPGSMSSASYADVSVFCINFISQIYLYMGLKVKTALI